MLNIKPGSRLGHTPSYCPLCCCRMPATCIICQYCATSLPFADPACVYCALPLSGSKKTCTRCAWQPTSIRYCSTVFWYQPPIEQLIYRLKFNADLVMGRILATLLAQRILASGRAGDIDLVLPVPLSRWRQARRGYNQALEISRDLAAILQLRHTARALRRHGHGFSQTGLSAHARRINVHNAFTAKSGLVENLRLALVDDVLTTGATTSAAADVLLAAGCRSVDIWVLARTP